MARQASSTVLAVFTIAIAGSVTIGGVLYDTLGWQGTSVFHLACVISSLLLLIFQPAVFKSFKETWQKWFKREVTKLPGVATDNSSNMAAMSVVPIASIASALGSVEEDLQVEDIDVPGVVKNQSDFSPGRKAGARKTSEISNEAGM